jgi:hypothetical protein
MRCCAVFLDGPVPVNRRAEMHSSSRSRGPSIVMIGVLENEGIITLRNVGKYCHISGHFSVFRNTAEINQIVLILLKDFKKQIILEPPASGLMTAVWKASLCEDAFQ